MSFKLTLQQNEIVQTNLKSGEILKIIAFAGTGKTTTLIEYTKLRPQLRFLYVAFNKSVQIEASTKFPKNVQCRTAHSLAWQRFGAKFRERLVSDIKPYMIREVLDLANYEDAKYAINTLYNYLISADSNISVIHIPKIAYNFYRYHKKQIPDLVKLANKLWKIMLSGEDQNVGMIHDGYLKSYQLSNPKLNFDCILLDEAQDINPVIADIVISQKCSKIIVGDPHQQIYSFRGAQDILSRIHSEKIKYLTHSFRFTNNIANLANVILHIFKKENNRLIGLKSKSPKKQSNNYTYITRTNAFVFDKAAELHKNRKIGFVGGINGYRFNRIQDAYFLYIGENEKIKNPYISWFNSYNEMKEYAQSVEDWELMGICKVVEKHNTAIPQLINDIKNSHVDQHAAEILLTTAHKAKGLEWESTFLADDFPPLINNDKIIDSKDLDPDEFNLIYVAITRSKQKLRVSQNSSLKKFIQKSNTIEKQFLTEPKENIKTIENERSIVSSKEISLKKRKYVYVPKINPNTFLLFFQKSDSYSLREYPEKGGVNVSYSNSYPYTADEILDLADFIMDAPTHKVTDEDFWRKKIRKKNEQYLSSVNHVAQDEDTSELKSTRQKEPNGGNDKVFRIINENGENIESVEDWLQLSPPKKGEKHWKDGRSAKELAKRWFPEIGNPKVPIELIELLNNHPDIKGTTIREGTPECKVKLDNFRGETRNTDLVLLGEKDGRIVSISIEAKADELFDKTLNEKLKSVEEKPNSKIPKRIEILCQSLFGSKTEELSILYSLRYQLLNGVAGALIEAKNRNAALALFVVHVFMSSELDQSKVDQNSRDYIKFIQLLSNHPNSTIDDGMLIGPIRVEGGPFVASNIPLYVGKILADLNAP